MGRERQGRGCLMFILQFHFFFFFRIQSSRNPTMANPFPPPFPLPSSINLREGAGCQQKYTIPIYRYHWVPVQNMNFIKNSFNKLFGAKEEKPSNKKEPEPTADIPEQELLQLFELTAKALSSSKQTISDQTKLQLYGLYKQVTVGDCNTPKPALYQFVNKAKWEAWNKLKGVPKAQAMQGYISTAVGADPAIQKKLLAELQGEEYVESEVVVKNKQDSFGLKMVEQKDYSDAYSHPYFKRIEKGAAIEEIDHALLLQVNNSPKVYPLHFAIEKERADLVKAFLDLLSVQEIEGMKDEEGTGILEYAELMENEEILELIKAKL